MKGEIYGNRLQEAFRQWLEWHGDYSIKEPEECYKRARNTLWEREICKPTISEANYLLLGYKPKTKGERNAGLFVSACYNLSDESEIVFDIDACDVDLLGYKCEKTLINNGKTGNRLGKNSSGITINNGETGEWFGVESAGLLINNGRALGAFGAFSRIAINNMETGDGFGFGSHHVLINNGRTGDRAGLSNGFVVNMGETGESLGQGSKITITLTEPKSYNCFIDTLLKPEDCEKIPELKEYLKELSEISRTIKDGESARRFLEKYGSKPEKRIEQDIKDILKVRGFKV